jgi:prepilin signal peptidase PulO-like enzyme (type II secretory pathway)
MDELEGLKGSQGKADKLVRRQSIVKVVVIFLMYVFLVVVPFADRRGMGVMFEGTAMRWLGLVLAALGFALIFWSEEVCSQATGFSHSSPYCYMASWLRKESNPKNKPCSTNSGRCMPTIDSGQAGSYLLSKRKLHKIRGTHSHTHLEEDFPMTKH